MSSWLTAVAAAERLGVKPATLYAYVSRGQLRRRRAADGRRSEYHPDDVAALAVRGRRARPVRPSDIIVPTAITQVTDRGPAYRGTLAVELAGHATFEQVAALVWDVPHEPNWTANERSVAAARTATRHLGDDLGAAERLLPAVSAIRSGDALRGEMRPRVVVATARNLIASLTHLIGGDHATGSVAARLAAAIAAGGDHAPVASESGVVEVVDAALVLLADHELAASTLAARVAASARCDPYAVVLAGLAVLSGPRHGAASRPLEIALREIGRGVEPETALQRQTQGGAAPGFGQPLYPQGDPRARRLLELLEQGGFAGPGDPLHAVIDLAERRGLPPPNIDVALAGLTCAIGAPVGTGELIFSIARIVGWVAHAMEQYAQPRLLRPTAVYTGTPAPSLRA